MADTGTPVRRARVWAETPRTKMGEVLTDSQGRYVLKELPHERYRVSASKAPFVTMKYGQRYPNGPDTEVDLTSASSARRVDIALWLGGVIAGRLYDDLGEPAAFTQVVALRVRVRGGQRTFVPTGRAGTADDLGQYRLAGLPTGSYIVATVPARDGYRLAPSYFPGTQDGAAATRVSVTAGRERSGVDFELGFAPTANVRGVVLGDSGRPIAATLLLSNGFDTTTTGTTPDGRFEFTNVSPGSYDLSAILQADPGSRRMTFMPLRVDGDLDGVVLRLDRGTTLGGTVTTDEGVPPAFDAGAMALELSPVPDTPFS